MTTSPYDNLPKYIDVEVTPPPAPVVETEAPKPAHQRPNVAHERPKAAPKPPKPATMIPLTPPPKYAGLSIKNLQGCFEYILPFEESLLVPDTMPDMQKALFAEGRVDTEWPDDRNPMRHGHSHGICHVQTGLCTIFLNLRPLYCRTLRRGAIICNAGINLYCVGTSGHSHSSGSGQCGILLCPSFCTAQHSSGGPHFCNSPGSDL